MKILIVDDHPVLREGLAALLRQIGGGSTVLEAGTAQDGFALLAQEADLDLVMLDLILPGLNGLPALAEMRRLRPTVPVIVLSSSEDARDVQTALAQGALGYVPKSASQRTLLAAIDIVMSGDRYIPPLILGLVGAPDEAPAPAGERPRGPAALTGRQVEVLRLLSDGVPNKTIATALDLSEKTVKAHVTAIFKALDVVNRTQAAAAGRKAGLI